MGCTACPLTSVSALFSEVEYTREHIRGAGTLSGSSPAFKPTTFKPTTANNAFRYFLHYCYPQRQPWDSEWVRDLTVNDKWEWDMKEVRVRDALNKMDVDDDYVSRRVYDAFYF